MVTLVIYCDQKTSKLFKNSAGLQISNVSILTCVNSFLDQLNAKSVILPVSYYDRSCKNEKKGTSHLSNSVIFQAQSYPYL